jgi:DMSO/TMAO reductase YedYZ molybdopterin-dependent catalytic subunit
MAAGTALCKRSRIDICMTRRDLLLLPGASLLPHIRASEPQNLSFPLQSIEGAITPPDMFFVRDHFREPEISLRSWRLSIGGRVDRALELGLADLIEAPLKKVESLLECAGNAAGGSAASNGIWEGVPLAYLLQEAGASRDASAVALEGADSGRLLPDSPDLPYCQVVPMAKCLRPESIVAFKLNDQFLPRKNGFPARALFPGWYAMDSVKWLRRITVLSADDEPSDFRRSGMNKVYNRIVQSASGDRQVTRLQEVLVKSAIAWPADKMNLPAAKLTVRGFAWTGDGVVRSVEVSTDGGRAWVPARLETRPKQFGWVRWSYTWTPTPGDYVLMSRATDDSGRQQPLQRDHARKDGYELNFCPPVTCVVR